MATISHDAAPNGMRSEAVSIAKLAYLRRWTAEAEYVAGVGFAEHSHSACVNAPRRIDPYVLPLVVLVDRDPRVDESHGHLVERRIDLAARRDELALGNDRLPFFAELEVVEQQRRMRVRRLARHADAVRTGDGVSDREPVDRCPSLRSCSAL